MAGLGTQPWRGTDGRGRRDAGHPSAAISALAAAAAARRVLYRDDAGGSSGLAMLRGEVESAGLFEAAFLDELWQAERWGSDHEAEERRAGIRRELDQAHRFLALCRDRG